MMKSVAEKFVMLLIISTLCSAVVVYYKSGPTLTSFPHDIPEYVGKIVIQKTRIAIIDYIEPFPNLTRLFLGKNVITQFPDLSNISDNLENCFLSKNAIATVGFIPRMKMLRILALGGNKLTRVPDLTNVSSTLEELYLEDNHIFVVDGLPPLLVLRILTLESNRLREFPDLRNAGSTLVELNLCNNSLKSFPHNLLKPLVALDELHLGEDNRDRFVLLPNVCTMARTKKPLTIKLYSNYTICDIDAAYVKLAAEAGRLQIVPQTGISSLMCGEPHHLAGKLLSDVDITEMIGK